MANEYLTRTPTSTGNRHVHTVSVWAKIGSSNSLKYRTFFAAGSSSPNARSEYGLDSNGNYNMGINDNGSLWHQAITTAFAKYGDGGSWMHFCVSVNSTLPLERDRIRFWINGSIYPYTVASPLNINAITPINDIVGHYVGRYVDASQYWDGELSDFFLVDGEALTPDVFGFYKEGKGYQSSGTTKATDFRPGQWSPHSPRKIKTEIERNGGFGVNGIYLPMNDSSNFGADFHCTPNTIIKLKGEDLPQPRNGAPTTTDAYVSQLREDPYAANLVLAVPGASTSTSANLITNGTFDSDISGWTTVQATTSWRYGAIRIVPNISVNGGVYQSVTTEVGKRYTLSYEISYATNLWGRVHAGTSTDINSADKYAYTNGDLNNKGVGKYTTSFTAATTTTIIWLEVGGGQSSTLDFDNIVLKQEDAPRDYSADIKGNGINKTLTPNGNAGVGYEISGYYGSAMIFDGDGDYLNAGSSSDFDFGSGDFTVEYWQNIDSNSPDEPGVGIWDDANDQRSWLIYQNTSGLPRFFVSTDGTSAGNISISSNYVNDTIPDNQWNHICMERSGSTLAGYVNGVCVGVNTSLETQSLYSPVDPLWIGRWSTNYTKGKLQDLRIYKGIAKYNGGFDVPKPYTPIGIGSWRQSSGTCNGNNFATMEPLASTATHTNGGLTVQPSSSVNYSASISNLMVNSGKWYCELRFDEESTGNIIPGISELENLGFRDIYGGANGTNFFGQSIDTNDTAGVRFGITANDGDIISMYMDLDSSPITCSFTVNGGSATTYNSNDLTYNYNNLIPGRTYGFVVSDAQSAVTGIQATFNFGQNPTFSGQDTTPGTYTDANGKGLFKYQPPTGYLALCTDNLPTPAIADPGDHFKTVLWTGGGNSAPSRSISDVGFKPDLVWIKERNNSTDHVLVNSISGASRYLSSNDPRSELPYSSGPRTFDTNGFTIGPGSAINGTDDDYVAWCWKAGGAAVTNTDGSITSQVSANQTAGFSIVSYTGNQTDNATVGHGLGKVPDVIIVKNRNSAVAWGVWHSSLTSGQILRLNTTTEAQTPTTAYFQDENNTSSVFALGTNDETNDDDGDTYIAYCWAEIEGYSKFGTYTGIGGSDGTFINCGFKPAFLMIKRTDSNGEWWMYDSSRGSTNPIPRMLMANSNSDEQEDSASYLLDLVSNGFKWRSGLAAAQGNGNTFIYIAFAESPLQTANAK